MRQEPVMSEIQKVNRKEELTQREVHQFWVDSTNDFFSAKKTGIDISHRQDVYWKFLDLWEKQVILKNVPDGLILDLGAGTGRITNFLRARGKKIIASDFVFECLTAIENSGPDVSLANMNATAIGLQTASLDCVVSCRVLQSLPTKEEKETALREISRILKPGGTLILTEGNPLRVKLVPVPYNFYITMSEWKELLRKNGFSIQEEYGIPFLSASKVLDKISLGLVGRFKLPFQIANFADHRLGSSFLKNISLQFDLIAKKI
jgi:ubiquinone/menaquinone biosynthesis C-methylase UbiE